MDTKKQNEDKKRSLIVVGPDGRSLHLDGQYQDPKQWQAMETDGALLLVARPPSRTRKPELLEMVAIYVDEHLSEKITLRDVANHCGVSVSTITQLFQKRAGMTFHNFLTQRRMMTAEQLIRQGVPMEDINRQVGYQDYSSFYRAFCQSFGLSPREYKRSIK